MTKKDPSPLSIMLTSCAESLEYADLLLDAQMKQTTVVLAGMFEESRKKWIADHAQPDNTFRDLFITFDYPDDEAAKKREWHKAALMVVDGLFQQKGAFGTEELLKFTRRLDASNLFNLDRMEIPLDKPITFDTIDEFTANGSAS